MDLTDLINSFQNWLKTLSDGEATFYGMALSAVVSLCIWFLRRLFQHRKNPENQNDMNKPMQNKAAQPDQGQMNIKIDKVSAKKKGIAIGVNIGSKEIKSKDQE